MAKYHVSNSGEIDRMINDARKLSATDLRSLYGIIIEEDGQVFDETFQRQFANIAEWANFSVEQDGGDFEFEEKFGSFYDEDDF